MRASMAYFAGAGTVIAAIVGGVGGGLLIADMVSPKSPKQGVETTQLERRMSSPQPIPVSNAPSQASNAPSEPVPYLTGPRLPAAGSAAAAVPAQKEAENSTPTPKPADLAASAQPAAAAAQPATPAVQVVAREQPAATDDAVAKARDADVKRVTEKRRAERRQQWTERRRQQRQDPQRQDLELQAVEEKVREDTGPRREFVAEPRRERVREARIGGRAGENGDAPDPFVRGAMKLPAAGAEDPAGGTLQDQPAPRACAML
jgi:hypothetical protein